MEPIEYGEGVCAYGRSVPINGGPYHYRSQQGLDWARGWHVAERLAREVVQ